MASKKSKFFYASLNFFKKIDNQELSELIEIWIEKRSRKHSALKKYLKKYSKKCETICFEKMIEEIIKNWK